MSRFHSPDLSTNILPPLSLPPSHLSSHSPPAPSKRIFGPSDIPSFLESHAYHTLVALMEGIDSWGARGGVVVEGRNGNELDGSGLKGVWDDWRGKEYEARRKGKKRDGEGLEKADGEGEEEDSVPPSTPLSPLTHLSHLLTTHLPQLINLHPPFDKDPNQRFGNFAFRRWYEDLESKIDGWMKECLGLNDNNNNNNYYSLLSTYLLPSLIHHFLHSFGDPTRIDYGTGHELEFLAFLSCWIIEWEIVLDDDDHHHEDDIGNLQEGSSKSNSNKSVTIRLLDIPSPIASSTGFNISPTPPPPPTSTSHPRHLFQPLLNLYNQYLSVCRDLQRIYNLEPAGSKGVYGLDDHQHLNYIFGSAQFLPPPEITNTPAGVKFGSSIPPPSSLLSPPFLTTLPKPLLFPSSLLHVHSLKSRSAPFQEHSPILHNILTTVPRWEKVNSGLKKMWMKEVLQKWPVAQHLWLTDDGPLRWRRVRDDPASGAKKGDVLPSTGSGENRHDDDDGAPEIGLGSDGQTKAPWATDAQPTPIGDGGTKAPWAASGGIVEGGTKAPWAMSTGIIPPPVNSSSSTKSNFPSMTTVSHHARQGSPSTNQSHFSSQPAAISQPKRTLVPSYSPSLPPTSFPASGSTRVSINPTTSFGGGTLDRLRKVDVEETSGLKRKMQNHAQQSPYPNQSMGPSSLPR